MELNLNTLTKENFQDTLLAELKYSPENINDAFVDQPAKFAYWSTLAVQAKALVQEKTLEVEHQEEYLKKTLAGKLDSQIRGEMEKQNKKVTEARIANMVVSCEEYVSELDELHRLQSELLKLQNKYSLLSIAKEAFMQRKDMIISLGANLRQELGN